MKDISRYWLIYWVKRGGGGGVLCVQGKGGGGVFLNPFKPLNFYYTKAHTFKAHSELYKTNKKENLKNYILFFWKFLITS